MWTGRVRVRSPASWQGSRRDEERRARGRRPAHKCAVYKYPGKNGLALAGVAGFHALVKFRGLASRNRQWFPLIALEVFGEQDDLAAVVGVMRELARDGLHHGMGLAANGCGTHEFGVRERRESAKHEFPGLFPTFHHLFPSRGRVGELAVAVAIRFFTVGVREAGPPRAHVAGQVLDDDRDRIHLRVENREELV